MTGSKKRKLTLRNLNGEQDVQSALISDSDKQPNLQKKTATLIFPHLSQSARISHIKLYQNAQACAAKVSGRKKKSLSRTSSRGYSPATTACAFVTIRLLAA